MHCLHGCGEVANIAILLNQYSIKWTFEFLEWPWNFFYSVKHIKDMDSNKSKVDLFINFIWTYILILKYGTCRNSPWNLMKLLDIINLKSDGISSIFIRWCAEIIIFIAWMMSGFNSWCDWNFGIEGNVRASNVRMFNICGKSISRKMWQLLNCMTTTMTGTIPAKRCDQASKG